MSFDIPYPANYGGVIDVFYKLKALWAEGAEITLHCFRYRDRQEASELEKYCSKVYYYPRYTYVNPLQRLPYIVATRNHEQLLHNLCVNEAPILFEALHSCFFLEHPSLENRRKIVRMHNIEHDYYRLLAEAEPNLLKRAYYYFESKLLLRYENVLKHADKILAISPNDYEQLSRMFKGRCVYLPAFHANTEVTGRPGKGSFCFYHGKLSVPENNSAALFLVRDVFSKLQTPFVIAGDGASAALKDAVKGHGHISLRENIDTGEIDRLIADAHVNVVTTFQPTGIKLKLLNVLYKGRFVLTNPAMVDNTGLSGLCLVQENAAGFTGLIPTLMQQEFTSAEIENRSAVLNQMFNVKGQAKTLMQLAFAEK